MLNSLLSDINYATVSIFMMVKSRMILFLSKVFMPSVAYNVTEDNLKISLAYCIPNYAPLPIPPSAIPADAISDILIYAGYPTTSGSGSKSAVK